MNESVTENLHHVFFDFPPDPHKFLQNGKTEKVAPYDYYYYSNKGRENGTSVTSIANEHSKNVLLKELESLVEQLANPKSRLSDSIIIAGHNIAPSIFQNNLTPPPGHFNTDPYLLPKCIFIAFLTVLIVSFNTTFIWVLTKNRDSFNADLYSCYNLSIAVADLMMGLFVTPLSIYPAYYGWWVYGNLACKVTSYLQVVIWIVVWCHFMWIAADRYVALRRPYKYENGSSQKTRYKCWIAFSWLTAALITSPHLYGYKWSRYNKNSFLCVLDWRLMTAYSLTVGALIMVPTSITLGFAYTRIFKQIFLNYLAHVRAKHAATSTMNPSHSPTNQDSNCNKFIFNQNPAQASSNRGRDSYYKRVRKSIVGGFTNSVVMTGNGRRANARKKSVKHSLLHPGETFVCDSTGTPLISKKSQPPIFNPSTSSTELKNIAGSKGSSWPKPMINPPTYSKVNTGLNSPPPSSAPSTKISSTSSGGDTSGKKLGKLGSSTENYYTDSNYLPVTTTTGTSFDNSSYLISFLNVILFVMSWLPWLILIFHTSVSQETTTTSKGRGNVNRLTGDIKMGPATLSQTTPAGWLSRSSGYGPMIDLSSSHISLLDNPYHPNIDFLVSWLVISNSLWKPVLYWALDRKFRLLVASLFFGGSSSSFNNNQIIIKV